MQLYTPLKSLLGNWIFFQKQPYGYIEKGLDKTTKLL